VRKLLKSCGRKEKKGSGNNSIINPKKLKVPRTD
jgi:hypothetical protein